LAEGNFEADLTALVVGASFTDGLAARAEGGDGNGDGDFESELLAVERGIEVGLIVDQAAGGSDGRLFFDEVGKIEFEVGGIGLEAFL